MLVEVPHNTVLQGHVLDKLRELPSDCVDVVVTSTPYYGLRDYGPDCVSVWGGKVDCEHDFQLEEILEEAHLNKDFNERWGNAVGAKKQEAATGIHSQRGFCSKCGSWKGQLGLEPHPSMFIEHLAQVFHEIKRVLKPSGSLWLNLGDTYFGGNGQCCRPKDWGDLETAKIEAHAPSEFIRARNKLRSNWLQPKQKMLIPARVAIALQDQGWILRNEIVWHKVNHMPESCRDRLTRSWESLYFFVKDDKYYFDLNAIRKPLAVKTLTVHNKYSVPVLQGDSFDVGYAKKENGFNAMFSKNSKVTHNLRGCNPGDVWTLTNEGLKDEHFAAFPQKLVRRILECSAPKGGLVLDPFAGSGTSLLVAHKMGFDWLGIELVPKYCEIIEKRIERHGKIRLDKFMPFISSDSKEATL
jgi:site-specific DNA-methyltransferase (cytosine-N4-specific)